MTRLIPFVAFLLHALGVWRGTGSVQLNSAAVSPREMEDNTEKAVLRDYTRAWQALATALAENNSARSRMISSDRLRMSYSNASPSSRRPACTLAMSTTAMNSRPFSTRRTALLCRFVTPLAWKYNARWRQGRPFRSVHADLSGGHDRRRKPLEGAGAAGIAGEMSFCWESSIRALTRLLATDLIAFSLPALSEFPADPRRSAHPRTQQPSLELSPIVRIQSQPAHARRVSKQRAPALTIA